MRFCAWNVHGFNEHKCNVWKEYLSLNDVICLTETWQKPGEKVEIPGYQCFPFNRGYKHPKAWRYSGGMAVYLKHDLVKYTKVHKNFKDNIAWFNLKLYSNDIYFASLYFPPENSTCYGEVNLFDVLIKDIITLPKDGQIILCGDTNSRTGILDDYVFDVEGKDNDMIEVLQSNIVNVREKSYLDKMIKEGYLSRNSLDKQVNEAGQDMINLCKMSQLIICNGRLYKDNGIGEYTRDDTTGKSVVDYFVVSPSLVENITDFCIGNKHPESDHKPLILAISFRTDEQEKKDNDIEFTPIMKFAVKKENMAQIKMAFGQSKNSVQYEVYRSQFEICDDVNKVAQAFTNYVCCTIGEVVEYRCKGKNINTGAPWYDKVCKQKRKQIVNSEGDENLMDQVKEYRALKQNKERTYKRTTVEELGGIGPQINYKNLWEVLNSVNKSNSEEPSPSEFYEYFKQLSKAPDRESFNHAYVEDAIKFLEKYDKDNRYFDNVTNNGNWDNVNYVLNVNFTSEEVDEAICTMKSGKSAGLDAISPDVVKYCKEYLIEDLTDIFNYIIENRKYPDIWAQGMRVPIPKPGNKLDVNNFRGITVLSVMTKIFEIIVNKRFVFVKELTGTQDRNNGGFVKGSRTADNMFILNGIIEKQMILRKPLFICFVDFSKAFDIVNRYILFFKLIKSNIKGRVIDTVRDIYTKTKFQVKTSCGYSPLIQDMVGVNQGGNFSPTLFREYLNDLGSYLSHKNGIVIGDEIISHLLWADDLILLSETSDGLQAQLNGLEKFCSNNQMIINETKTKIMIYGRGEKVDFKLNGKVLDITTKYKYLGNIFNTTCNINGNPMRETIKYLNDNSIKAVYGLYSKTQPLSPLPPKINFTLFDSLVKPVAMYGSDIWGVYKIAEDLDKIQLRFIKSALGVKTSTATVMVYGETGRFPLTIETKINAVKYYVRLREMKNDSIVKQVFFDLSNLHSLGFKTWVSDLTNMLENYDISYENDEDVCCIISEFDKKIHESFVEDWQGQIQNESRNIFKLYRTIKFQHSMEQYLYLLYDNRYRVALSRLRCSSHALEIEKGRHNKIERDNRICKQCSRNNIEDEIHFVLYCDKYRDNRSEMFEKICNFYPDFKEWDDNVKCNFLFTNENMLILAYFGKFVYHCFRERTKI